MVAFLAACILATSPSQPKQAGFLATSPSGKGPGVLVLHPWWGLNADVKAYCKRLAKEGFVAYAPDLFHGKVASTIPQAEVLAKGAKDAEVQQAIDKAVKVLSSQTADPSAPIAVVGFSFGAYYALHLSNADPDRVRKVVVYYGTGETDFSKSKAEYLGHFAEKDQFEPRKAVDGLEKLLHKWKRPSKFFIYKGTGHWFSEPSRKDAYKKPAAESAWKETVAFLKKPNP